MLKIYGSRLCPDCVNCLQDLDTAGVAYTYLDFGEDLRALKTFLHMRDSSPVFEQAKAAGSIGIPCLVEEDGTISLTWEQYRKDQPL